MTSEDIIVQGIYRLVDEVTESNKREHDAIVTRIDDMEERLGKKFDGFNASCSEHREDLEKRIEEIYNGGTALEVSTRTVCKFTVGLIVNAGVIAGLAYTVMRIVSA